jgi:hypothetical protein
MRWFLAVLAFVNGGAFMLMVLAGLTEGGSDIQIIGAGVFMTAFAICLGLIGVMVRLEEIRDRKN